MSQEKKETKYLVDNPEFVKLVPAKQRWILHVLEGETNRDAAVKAGYSEKTAMVKGAKLSKELGHIVNGQRAEEKRHVQKMAMVDKERWLQELTSMAFFNVKDMVDENGVPLPITQLSRKDASAISSIEVNSSRNGRVKRFKFHEKLKALEVLGKALEFYDDSNKDNHPLANVKIEVLLDMKRDLEKRAGENVVDITPSEPKELEAAV